MRIKKSEKIIMSIMVIVLLVVIILGISYAAFTYSNKQEEENAFTAACYDIAYDEEAPGVTFEKKYPVTDDQGLAQEPYTLTITNNCKTTIGYNIMLNILNDSTTPLELMKVSANDDIKKVSWLSKGESSITDKKEAYTVLAKNLDPEESVTYKLRAWMDINSTSGQETQFSNKISVEISPKPYLAGIILKENAIRTETPDFKKGYPNTTDNDSTLSGLYAAPDDYGTSYYFRGDKDFLNNNVTFANMNWKILRINGDGTVRLILDGVDTHITSAFNDYTKEDSTPQHEKVGFTYGNDEGKECTREHPCEVTYDGTDFSNAKFGGQNSDVKNTLETWYKENLSSQNDKIAYGLFCNDVSYGSGTDDGSTGVLHYGGYERFEYNSGNPTLICPEPNNKDGKPRTYGGLYKTKIGLITADEMNMGGFSKASNPHASVQNYLRREVQWWSMTPSYSHIETRVYDELYNGGLDCYWSPGNAPYLRVVPVINLRADVSFTTNGTGSPGSSTNPYIVQ